VIDVSSLKERLIRAIVLVNIGLWGFLFWLKYVANSHLQPLTDTTIEASVQLIELGKSCLEAKRLLWLGLFLLLVFVNSVFLFTYFKLKDVSGLGQKELPLGTSAEADS